MPMTRCDSWPALTIAILVIVANLAGCGGDDPPADTGQTPIVDETAQGSGADEASSTTVPGSQKATPSSPDPVLAIRSVLEGVRDSRGEAIWEFLPDRYQKDINSLVRELAGRMDAATWARTVKSLRRVVAMAKAKKDLLISNPGLPLQEIDQKQLGENWPTLLGLFTTILDSELADTARMAEFDGQSFFSTTGTRFLKQLRSLSATGTSDPLGRLAQAEITVVEKGQETALVRIVGSDDTEPTQPSQFLLIDGKWFPAQLSASIEESLRLARKSVNAMPQATSGTPPKNWTAILDALDSATAALEKANSTDAFNKSLADAQLALVPLLARTAASPTRPSSIETTITVLIQGTLDETARKDHIAALRTLAKSEEVPDVTSSNDATTVILTTSQPLQAIVDGIKFGKVSRIDERKRSITVIPGQRNKPGA